MIEKIIHTNNNKQLFNPTLIFVTLVISDKVNILLHDLMSSKKCMKIRFTIDYYYFSFNAEHVYASDHFEIPYKSCFAAERID